MRKLALLLVWSILLVSLASVCFAADRAQIVDITNQTVNLTFGNGVSASYADNVGSNEDVGLRVFSSDPQEILSGSYVCLAYGAHTTWYVVNFGTTSPSGPCEPLRQEEQFNATHRVAYTSLSHFGFDGTLAIYPGQPYAVLSDDAHVSLDDQFIPLNPNTDGWLVGADGGDPCPGGAGIWLANCSADSGASLFDSYDITFEDLDNSVRVVVNASYYPAGGVIRQATIDAEAIVVSIVDSSGSVEDAKITSIYDPVYGPDTNEDDDVVELFYGSALGKRTIYVNGIQTAEFVPSSRGGGSSESSSPSQSGSGSSSGSQGSGSGSTYISGDSASEGLVWVFPIDDEYVHEITVYVTEPLDSASLFVTSSPFDSSLPILSSYLIETDIPDSTVEAIFVDFTVPEDWLLDLGLYKQNVVIIEGDNPYDVVLRSDVGDSFSYAAHLSEFGRFAIAGSDDRSNPLADNIREDIEVVYPSSGFPWYIFLWVLLIIIIILLLFYIFKEERKEHEDTEER